MTNNAKAYEEIRAHPRYYLRNQTLARVKFANNQSYALRDISYAGFSLDTGLNRVSSDQVRIEFLDTGTDAFATLVHTNQSITGFSFQHRTVETLIFLQPFIERIRVGQTIVPIKSDLLSGKYQEPGWSVHRGDGPTDLVYRSAENKEPESLLLTFRDGERYVDFRLKDNKLYTSRQVDKVAESPRMGQTLTFDRALARQGLYILAGVQDPAFKPIFKRCLDLFPK